MTLAQSPHIPSEGRRPRLKDLRWLVGFSCRGLFELIRARLIFANLKAKAIPARNRASQESENAEKVIAPAQLARIAYVLPRISDRIPWRSDCLVQAIAAQNWLSAIGEASEIQIGVEHPADGAFGAHAWLLCKEQVVTGGDIDRYHLILSDSRLDRDSDNQDEGSEGN